MIEKGEAKSELGGAVAIGHEAEVTDAMEAIGQRVKKEAADELVGFELHDLCRAILAVILPGEGDMILVEGDEPAVGDCDTMGIAAEIGENLGRTAKGSLGIDDQLMRRMATSCAAKAAGSARGARSPKKFRVPASKAAVRRSRSMRLNSRASGLTARKKFGRLAIQRVASGDGPPPGTTQWRWG